MDKPGALQSQQLIGVGTAICGASCWQLGADWGAVSEQDALATLHAGVSFLDTARVYGHPLPR